jgi:hypothetical protein
MFLPVLHVMELMLLEMLERLVSHRNMLPI